MDMSVCGEADTAAEAFQMVETLRPPIAIVDISLKDANGVALTEKIHTHYSDMNTVVHSTHDETVHAERAIRARASGHVMKGEPTKRLIEAIRAVRRAKEKLGLDSVSELQQYALRWTMAQRRDD